MMHEDSKDDHDARMVMMHEDDKDDHDARMVMMHEVSKDDHDARMVMMHEDNKDKQAREGSEEVRLTDVKSQDEALLKEWRLPVS
eukprot:1157067-Pelagomonas_calceolata.AAC.13